jgi:hypothetical protein
VAKHVGAHRVEIRYPRQGWVPLARGLSWRKAEAVAKSQRETEAYYDRFGGSCPARKVRIVPENL